MPDAVTLDICERSDDRGFTIDLEVSDLIIAGWTGRDGDAIEAHIKELEEIGVPRPSTVPCFYRVAGNLLSSRDTIEVIGSESSGEVEVVLYGTDSGMLVGLGSDHTDRKVETYSVAVSKQMCAKPISRDVWRFDDVAGHWDELVLRSWASFDGDRRLYQEGLVTAMRAPADLIGLYCDGDSELVAGSVMFCGTLPVHGGVAAAEQYELELDDPVLGRKLTHTYSVRSLPVVA